MRWRNNLIQGGKGAKQALGVVLIGVGLLIATGYDKRVEASLVEASPDWLTQLTTRFSDDVWSDYPLERHSKAELAHG